MIWISLLLSTFINNADAKKAKEGEGVDIEITVLDAEDNTPIPTAVIKHSEVDEPARVNESTGAWKESEVFDARGNAHPFSPGNTEQFSISASGYLTTVVAYDVRKRHNVIEIKLQKMVIDDDDITEDIVLPFIRNEALDGGQSGGGAN